MYTCTLALKPLNSLLKLKYSHLKLFDPLRISARDDLPSP